MPLEYRDDGILVGDTGILAAITGRRPGAIRVLCERGPEGYDADQCTNRLLENPDPILLTAVEAQRYLDIPANRIYQWVHLGELHVMDRKGRQPLYALDHLQRLQAMYRKPRYPQATLQRRPASG